jgi:hypothetical protein
MTRVIGLGGLLRSGKDTVADHLVEKHDFVKAGMSDALHEAMLTLDPYIPVNQDIQYPEGPPGFGWNTYRSNMRYSELTEALGYVGAKGRFPEYRRLLQAFGTDVARKLFGEDVWVDAMVKRVRELQADGRSVVITGLRFPNEIDAVYERLAGTTYWVDRGDATHGGGHASETSVRPEMFDRVIPNQGTLDELYEHVDRLI